MLPAWHDLGAHGRSWQPPTYQAVHACWFLARVIWICKITCRPAAPTFRLISCLRCEECLIVDLNAGEFPSVEADCVTLLGVLEYLHCPEETLRKAAEHVGRLIFSYATFWHGRTDYRRGMGWVNDFRRADLDAMLARLGWRIDAVQNLKLRWCTREYLIACSLT